MRWELFPSFQDARISLKELHGIEVGTLKMGFYKIDCSKFDRIPLDEFKGDEAKWNICIRATAKRTNLDQLIGFERQAWHSRPL